MKNLAAIASLLLLAGCSGGDIPSDSPYKSQSSETFSMQLKEYRTIDSQKMLHWFQEYVSDYQEPDASKMPASLAALKMSSSCRLAKPQPGSKLVQVITWNSKKYAPLYLIGDEQLERITKNFMAVVDRNYNPGLALSKREGQLQPVDVAVTEAAQPVHLVLASTGPVLWNLVPAPNARITGITIISPSGAVGIANAPDDVPVATLAGDAAEKCGAIPALMPVKQYPNVKMQLHRANDNDEKYATMLSKYKAYNAYFRKQFGVDSDDVSIGVSVMNHAAVGPVPANPESRIPFRTLENAHIKVATAPFVFFGSEDDYITAKKAAVIKAASEMTGGNYQAKLEKAGF